MTQMDAQVIGLGHVGLPLAALLADSGLAVRGVDVSARVRERVEAGTALSGEPGFAPLLARARVRGRLVVADAPGPARATVVAVPTPAAARPDGARAADLGAVLAAVRSLASHLRAGDLVVLTSTSPVGTTERIAAEVAALRGAGLPVDYAYAPERVIPGDTLAEMRGNDRLIGGLTEAAAARAAALFARFVEGRLERSDARTAELVKLAENASRDVAIAFANELAGLAEAHGLDPFDVVAQANRHPRVNILQPGVGVGGHCIPVDPWFLQDGTAPTPLMRAARAVNDARPARIVERVLDAVAPERSIACLGLSYKPDVDDFRESPAIEVARALTAACPGRVVCHDPAAEGVEGLALAPLGDALAADHVVLLVPHAPYCEPGLLDPERTLDVAGALRTRALPPRLERASA